MNNGDGKNPRVFVSYSWDSDEHRDWVESLATELRKVGVDARLDRWRDKNQGIDDFMMVELERADYVLAICTPEFKQKVLSNADGTAPSGSGTEIGTAAAMRRATGKPTVPVLARGTHADSTPSNLLSQAYYDFTSGDRQKVFDELKRHLLGQTERPPPLGEIALPENRPALPDILGANRDSEQFVPSTDDPGSTDHRPVRAPLARRTSAWLGVALIVIGIAFLIITFWPDGDVSPDIGNEEITKIEQFSFGVESVVLENCQGSVGRQTGNLLNAADEACILVNGEAIWGCDRDEGNGYACSRSGDDERLNTHLASGPAISLLEGMNEILILEEDRKGLCKQRYPAFGNDKCLEMGRMELIVDAGSISLQRGEFQTRAGVDWDAEGDYSPVPDTTYETLLNVVNDGQYRLIWRIGRSP